MRIPPPGPETARKRGGLLSSLGDVLKAFGNEEERNSMHIETDLKRIRQSAEERNDENWEFRTFLKHCDEDDIDAHVHAILREVEAQVDCAACMNCCRELRPGMSDADITRLAQALSMTTEDFRQQYVEKTEMGEVLLRGLPCPFLKDNRCNVEAHRPDDCRGFPYLHKDGSTERLMGVVLNYAICPIVYNVCEQLKQKLRWRPRRRMR